MSQPTRKRPRSPSAESLPAAQRPRYELGDDVPRSWDTLPPEMLAMVGDWLFEGAASEPRAGAVDQSVLAFREFLLSSKTVLAGMADAGYIGFMFRDFCSPFTGRTYEFVRRIYAQYFRPRHLGGEDCYLLANAAVAYASVAVTGQFDTSQDAYREVLHADYFDDWGFAEEELYIWRPPGPVRGPQPVAIELVHPPMEKMFSMPPDASVWRQFAHRSQGLTARWPHSLYLERARAASHWQVHWFEHIHYSVLVNQIVVGYAHKPLPTSLPHFDVEENGVQFVSDGHVSFANAPGDGAMSDTPNLFVWNNRAAFRMQSNHRFEDHVSTRFRAAPGEAGQYACRVQQVLDLYVDAVDIDVWCEALPQSLARHGTPARLTDGQREPQPRLYQRLRALLDPTYEFEIVDDVPEDVAGYLRALVPDDTRPTLFKEAAAIQ